MKRAAAGFTLMEVLGALALLALLLLGVYAGIRSATHTVRSGEAKIEQLDEIRAAQQFLRRELAQAFAQAITKDEGGNPNFFIGDVNEMRFVAPLPGYLGKYGPQLIRVRLVNGGKDGMRLEASLAELPPDGSAPKALGEPQILLDHIHGGGFSYRGFDQQGQPMDWQSDWKIVSRMPALVTIQLAFDDGREWPLLTVPLRVNGAAVQGPADLLRGLNTPVPQ